MPLAKARCTSQRTRGEEGNLGVKVESSLGAQHPTKFKRIHGVRQSPQMHRKGVAVQYRTYIVCTLHHLCGQKKPAERFSIFLGTFTSIEPTFLGTFGAGKAIKHINLAWHWPKPQPKTFQPEQMLLGVYACQKLNKLGRSGAMAP